MKSFRPPLYIKQVRFGEGSPYTGSVLDLQPFTVISGAHCAGKSTLLALIYESMNRGQSYSDQPPYVGYRPNRNLPPLSGREQLGGRIGLTVQEGAIERNFETDLDADDSAEEIIDFIPVPQDPYIIASDIQIFFQDFDGTHLREHARKPELQKKVDLDSLGFRGDLVQPGQPLPLDRAVGGHD
ncbi:hypothetical protein, partial [Streptomyces sp. NPDC000405]|uniref:hypothetical protein n=1 Tax=Streptomyces sp. NPDC000405 TaxID=3161033 RepID=UPI00398D1D61